MSKLTLACSACSAPWDHQTKERPFAVPCEACHAVEELALDITGKITMRRTLTAGTGSAYPPAEDVARMVEVMEPASETVPIARCGCGAPLLLDDGVKVVVVCGYCSHEDTVRAADVPAKCDLGHLDVAMPGGGLLRYRFAVRRGRADDLQCPWCDAPIDWEPGERACVKCGGAVGVGDDPHGLRSTAGVSVEGFDGKKNLRLVLTPTAAARDVEERLGKALDPAAEAREVLRPAAPPPAPGLAAAAGPAFTPGRPGAGPRSTPTPFPMAAAQAAAPVRATLVSGPPSMPPPRPAPPPEAAKVDRIAPPPPKAGAGGALVVVVVAGLLLLLSLVGAGIAVFAGSGSEGPTRRVPVLRPGSDPTPSGPFRPGGKGPRPLPPKGGR